MGKTRASNNYSNMTKVKCCMQGCNNEVFVLPIGHDAKVNAKVKLKEVKEQVEKKQLKEVKIVVKSDNMIITKYTIPATIAIPQNENPKESLRNRKLESLRKLSRKLSLSSSCMSSSSSMSSSSMMSSSSSSSNASMSSDDNSDSCDGSSIDGGEHGEVGDEAGFGIEDDEQVSSPGDDADEDGDEDEQVCFSNEHEDEQVCFFQ